MGRRTEIIVKTIKKCGIKVIKAIKERRERKAQEKEAQKEEDFIKEEQKILTPEETEEIDSAAYAMSRKWNYHKLMQAADIERAKVEGREVHGWMQRMFRHRYNWLLENYVFDYAVDYALKYDKPDVFNIVKDYDFEHAIINVIILARETNFDLFRSFKFDKIIVLTQGETFENAVYWIEGQPWTNSAGYSTIKTIAPCNLLNMGFPLHDLPVTVLKDAVGMDKLFFEAKTTAGQIAKTHDQILKKHIYTKRQEEITTDEKVLEMKIKYEQLKERHQYLIDDIKAGDTRNPEEKLKDFAEKYDKEVSYSPIDWRKIILGIIVAFLVVFIIIGCISFFAPKPEPPELPELPEIAKILLSNLLNRSC